MKPKNSQTPKGDAQIFDLTIDSLSYNGGRGVGRHGDVVVFVPMTAPQDRVRVRVVVQKPRFIEAEVIEILEPSPMRRQPLCPVFTRCGGCTWQHVSYSEQVRQKQGILNSSLRRLQKQIDFQILPFVPATKEYGYRNRIQIHLQRGRVGFFSKGSNDLVETRHCVVSEPAINSALEKLDVNELRDSRRVELAVDETTNEVVIRRERDPQTALFGQIHQQQNEVLKTMVVERIEGSPEWVMDLYAGAGNLTFPIADRVGPTRVQAVELSRESVQRGRASRDSDIDWCVGDVAQVLAQTKLAKGEGCIVLDPPRPGCEESVIAEILRHKPKQIVYVSCNPMTFARDAERLMMSGAYRLVTVQGIDMFPQTEHVELVAHLRAAT